MKKIIVLALFALFCVQMSFAQEGGAFGGIVYVGGAWFYNPQDSFNKALANLGYNGLSDMDWGMTWGGGGIVYNFFIGGWGISTFGDSSATNSSAGKTLTRGGYSGGGFEMGYAVYNGNSMMILPTINFIWGGRTFSFQTNMNFNDYINNPVKFDPEFSIGNIFIGGSLNFILHKENQINPGLLLKITYLYALNKSFSGPVMLNTPDINSHSIAISLNMAWGALLSKELIESQMGDSEDTGSK